MTDGSNYRYQISSFNYFYLEIEALPHVVSEVAGRVPIVMDSGVRDGTDVYKALALGADLVS